MDRKKNGQGKLPMWQERLRRNSAAMREEFERMDKRTALYNGTREIEKNTGRKEQQGGSTCYGGKKHRCGADGGTGGQQLSHAEGDGKAAGA